MSYNSEVLVVIRTSVYDEAPKEVVEVLNKFPEIVSSKEAMLFHWEFVDLRPYQKIVKDYLLDLDNDDFYFIRIGELLDDIDIMGEMYEPYEPQVERRITWS